MPWYATPVRSQIREQEYQTIMQEAKAEFDAWERENKKEKNLNKEKYRAQRLAKLHMREEFECPQV